MQVDSDVLLARLKADYPTPYELTLCRCLVDLYEAENQQLRAELDARDNTDGPLAGHRAVGYAGLPNMSEQPRV